MTQLISSVIRSSVNNVLFCRTVSLLVMHIDVVNRDWLSSARSFAVCISRSVPPTPLHPSPPPPLNTGICQKEACVNHELLLIMLSGTVLS